MLPSLPGLLQAISLFAVVLLLARPLGGYIRSAVEGERVFLSPIIRPIERGVYKVMRIDEKAEQGWKAYAVSVIIFLKNSCSSVSLKSIACLLAPLSDNIVFFEFLELLLAIAEKAAIYLFIVLAEPRRKGHGFV